MALTLRTDDELEHALDALVDAEGTSRQDVIRRAILDRYRQQSHVVAVQQSTAAMLEKWGDVLDRLEST